ncbi:protein bottleneck [Calliphora vicina]|uniref:protein bottleneck n=1 Tax=Calliphora vicina TaxID=7373 RepID=UPI00325BECEB
MSLTAYNFQFYSYNMATHRSECNDSGMDVDDIDMSIPPPKPPRASAVHGSNNSVTPQLSWMTSTPKSIVNEHQIMASPAATAIPAVNYLAVPNETPKSIYSSGLQKGATAQQAKPAELQLRPKLHATQKRWSFELREKALELSKRSSAASDEDDEQALQLKPQHHAGRKSWSCEIREKALQMSKRNSGSLETSPEPVAAATTANSMQHFGMNSTAEKENSMSLQTPSKVQLKKPLINAVAYEKMNLTTGGISRSANTSSEQFNNTFDAYFKAPQQMNATFAAEPLDPSQSVKDRICFFNKLTSPHSNSFIDLLKNSKTTNVATIQHTSSAQNTPLATPLKPKRWSTQLEMNLQQDIPTTTPNFFQQAPAILNSPSTSSSNSSLASSPSSASSTFTYSNTSTQRKSTLRRRASVEKSRRPILRPNSTVGSTSTKPQMHTVMEDLSLVMPVKLRVAEYERRIMMEY